MRKVQLFVLHPQTVLDVNLKGQPESGIEYYLR